MSAALILGVAKMLDETYNMPKPPLSHIHQEVCVSAVAAGTTASPASATIRLSDRSSLFPV